MIGIVPHHMLIISLRKKKGVKSYSATIFFNKPHALSIKDLKRPSPEYQIFIYISIPS